MSGASAARGSRFREHVPFAVAVTTLPLSFEQRMMNEARTRWGLSWWQPVPVALRVPVRLDPGALRAAAEALVRRHAILRARLVGSDDEPAQELREEVEVPFELLDLSGEDDDAVAAAMSARAERPFDLARDAPLRVVAAHLRDGATAVLLVGHHVFVDLPSVLVLLEEYLDLCAHLDPAIGAPAPVHDEGPGYPDYVVAQQELVRSERLERALAHWERELEGADPSLGAPLDADPVPATRAAPFALSPQDTAAALAHAREQGVTPFALAAAATYAAVREATGQDDLLSAVVTSARRAPYGRTVGQFADFFFLRQRPDGDPLGREHLQAVRRVTLAGMARFAPSELVRERVPALAARATRGHVPCATVLNYVPGGTAPPWPGADALGLDVAEQPFRVGIDQGRFSGMLLLVLFAREQPTLQGALYYEANAIAPARAEAMAATLSARAAFAP